MQWPENDSDDNDNQWPENDDDNNNNIQWPVADQ